MAQLEAQLREKEEQDETNSLGAEESKDGEATRASPTGHGGDACVDDQGDFVPPEFSDFVPKHGSAKLGPDDSSTVMSDVSDMEPGSPHPDYARIQAAEQRVAELEAALKQRDELAALASAHPQANSHLPRRTGKRASVHGIPTKVRTMVDSRWK